MQSENWEEYQEIKIKIMRQLYMLIKVVQPLHMSGLVKIIWVILNQL